MSRFDDLRSEVQKAQGRRYAAMRAILLIDRLSEDCEELFGEILEGCDGIFDAKRLLDLIADLITHHLPPKNRLHERLRSSIRTVPESLRRWGEDARGSLLPADQAIQAGIADLRIEVLELLDQLLDAYTLIWETAHEKEQRLEAQRGEPSSLTQTWALDRDDFDASIRSPRRHCRPNPKRRRKAARAKLANG
jgi:hypothetical protein